MLLEDSPNQKAVEQGLKTYSAYDVPAIAKEYIADMPAYDGQVHQSSRLARETGVSSVITSVIGLSGNRENRTCLPC